MFTSRYVIVAGLILHSSYAQRRIKDGKPVHIDHKFVVYFVKAPESPQKYDSWTCGGSLLTPEFIVTSAACVQDVQHLYAIAGYRKYVPYNMLQLDPCTRVKKKKVILICVPKEYEIEYNRVDKWANIDIAVVKVESPYDFNDTSYNRLCSYIPRSITFNIDPKYQEPGTDAVVFGWGHLSAWRKTEDGTNYNQESLRYASTSILKVEECKAYYERHPKLQSIIGKYMICTMGRGNLNDAGVQVNWGKPNLNDGCVSKAERMLGMPGVLCDFKERHGMLPKTRRGNLNVSLIQPTRRHGICQNDHGGPLVTWIGSNEVLIGVASVFRVNKNSQCQGPYLFTSTQCNSKFLYCMLFSNSSRRADCEGPPEKRGYDTAETHISWKSHPDGPADNEKEQLPQKNVIRPAENERLSSTDHHRI